MNTTDKILTMDEYMAREMEGKVAQRRQSPLTGLLLVAAGAGLLVAQGALPSGGSAQALTLTVGVLAAAVGAVLTVLCLTGVMSRWVWLPTGSPMRKRTVYLGTEDWQTCREAVAGGNAQALAALHPVTSSNSALLLLRSRDGAVALLQAGRYDTGHFEPETGVLVLTGTEVAATDTLCR